MIIFLPYGTHLSLACPNSECDWYLVMFLIDTAFGCITTITAHSLTTRLAANYKWSEPLSRLGDYEAAPDPETGERPPSTNNDRIKRWIAQVINAVFTFVEIDGRLTT